MGKIHKIAGPGTLLVLPCVDKAVKIDIRTNTIQVPPLQFISVDKGIIEMEAVVFVKVNDPVLAVCTIHEHEKVWFLLRVYYVFKDL
jgi:regulator of protease activity HflC (stomatin/prohibitin superfamily)